MAKVELKAASKTHRQQSLDDLNPSLGETRPRGYKARNITLG